MTKFTKKNSSSDILNSERTIASTEIIDSSKESPDIKLFGAD